MIPNAYTYIWFGPKPLPEEAFGCIASMKNKMPTWQSKFIDIHNVKVDDFLLECFSKKRWTLASNYLRLKEIYEYGGWYFDVDIEILKPLDQFRVQHCVFGAECHDFVNNGIFGASIGHPLLNDLIEKIKSKPISPHPQQTATGPRLLTDMLREDGWEHGDKSQVVSHKGESTIILAKDFFSPYVPTTGELNITDNTMAIHHFIKSWGQEPTHHD